MSSLKDELKSLVANTVALSLRAQGYHWNVEGPNFREYHGLFQEIYDDLHGSVDPIAENVRKLGDYAPYRLDRLAQMADLPEKTVNTAAHSMAEDLRDGIEAYLKHLNTAFAAAEEANEQGIADFLSGRIDSCQKWVWFLRASLHL